MTSGNLMPNLLNHRRPSQSSLAGFPQQEPRHPKPTQANPKRKGQTRSGRGEDAPSSVACVMLQMVMCVVGIYVCFGLWSIKQERVITKPYSSRPASHPDSAGGGGLVQTKLSTVFVIGFAQAVGGILVGSLLLLAERFLSSRCAKPAQAPSRRAPHLATLRMTAVMGFTNAFGSSLGYAAMRRLSYPVVLATKMSKMVPVMLVGLFWHGTRYSTRKCLTCAVITGAIYAFYALDPSRASGTPSAARANPSSPGCLGFVLLALNLLADGFTNSTQDVLVKTAGWSGNRLMVCTNLASAVWLAAVLLALEAAQPCATAFLETESQLTSMHVSGHTSVLLSCLGWFDGAARWVLREAVPLQDLSRTWRFFQHHPEAMWDVAAMSLLNAVGQFFVFRTISLFGTLTLTALTLLRKAGSVVLSILVHGHHVAAGQWISLAVVFLGVAWEAVEHTRGKHTPHKPQCVQHPHTERKGGGGKGKREEMRAGGNGVTKSMTPPKNGEGRKRKK